MATEIKHFSTVNETITKGDEYSFDCEFWTTSAKTTGIDISADDFFLVIKKNKNDPDGAVKVLKQTSDFTTSTTSPSAVVNTITVTCSGGDGSDMDIAAGDYFRAIKWVPSGSGGWTFIKGVLTLDQRDIEREAEV